MNSLRAKFEEALADGCRACLAEVAAELGPIQGPAPAPWRPERWSMTPAEWAGGGNAVQNSFDP